MMKLKLITLLMAFAIPSAFADCGKCKKHDEEKKEETVSIVDCGKDHGKKKECPEGCEKECCKKKETVTIADGEGCKKGGCKKEESTTIAHCGKCKKHDDEKKEEEKEETVSIADSDGEGCKKGGCKKESTLLAA